MAHFAILKAGNIVDQVVVVSNEIATTEQAGIDFLKKTFNDNHLPVIQTSYNSKIRKNFAGIGYQYDQTRDAFIPPKPFNSWILNEDTCIFDAPVTMPTTELEDNQYYSWNESIINWEIKTR